VTYNANVSDVLGGIDFHDRPPRGVADKVTGRRSANGSRRGPAPGEIADVLKESAALTLGPVSGAKEKSIYPWSALLNEPMLTQGMGSGNDGVGSVDVQRLQYGLDF